MSTRRLVAPDLLDLVDNIATDPLTMDTYLAFRSEAAARRKDLPAVAIEPQALWIESIVGAPPVQVLVYRPAGRAPGTPVVLHLHGGGMFSGTAELSPQSGAAIALAMGITVVSVAYRLAPETAFPGQIEDCYAVLAWLHEQADQLGIDRTRIVISGDSAGGGLAASLALMARDLGRYPLAAQILTYPMLDCRTGGPFDPYANPEGGEFCWTRAQNRFAWGALRGDYPANDERCGWFSPAMADDLSGLPPTWIGVGTLDLFHDECEAYAQRLAQAGVPASVQLYRGAPHAFNAVPKSVAAQAFRADLAAVYQQIMADQAGAGQYCFR